MLTENEKKILAAYEKRLQKPKWKFIIVNGLIWSGLVLMIMILQQFFIRGKSFKHQWDEGLPIRLIFLVIGGLIYGWIIHVLIKRKCDQLTQKSTN